MRNAVRQSSFAPEVAIARRTASAETLADPFGAAELSLRNGMAMDKTFTVLLVGILQGSSSSAAEDLSKRFFQEAPPKWAEFEDHYQVEGKISYEGEFQGVNGETNSGRRETFFAINRQWVRFETASKLLKNQKPSFAMKAVAGMNARYAFLLKKKDPTDEASPYLLVSLSKAGREFYQEISSLDFIRAPWIVLGFPLADLIKDPGFKVKQIENVSVDGRNCVRVTFDYSPTVRDPLWSRTENAELILDPVLNWCVKAYSIKMSENVCVGRFDYDHAAGSLPFIREYFFERTTKHGVATTRVKAHQIVYRDVPEHEFSLSAFGLPEPMQDAVPQPAPRWYIWFAVAALASFFTGLALRKLAIHLRSA